MDDAAIARMLMQEEMAAADAAGLDYSPTFRRKRRMSDESDYSPGASGRKSHLQSLNHLQSPSRLQSPSLEASRLRSQSPSRHHPDREIARPGTSSTRVIVPGVVVSTNITIDATADVREDGAICW